ncbi:MAG: GNAT family N-acetyltransferase [Anaerolineaceae bacterium]|nr:GNAT family N-acetyltransferase [Anaerolineaceae bacterium]
MAAPVLNPQETLITTYLEMSSPREFEPSFVPRGDVRIEKMESADVDFYLFLYRSVGEQWNWRDRLVVPREQIKEILAGTQTHVHVLYVDGAPAGYVELMHHGADVEIAYFGLREPFFGRGLGKHLLSYGINEAWKLDANRVWVHTCNLDGPHALNNYQKRGFKIFKQEAEPMPEIYQ